MHVFDVVTGEAVALDLRVAQLPSRIVAASIDFLVMIVALYAVLFVAGLAAASGMDDPALGAAAAVVVLIGVFLGYPLVFETLSRGRTLGKMMMGLRVVRDDGGPVTFRHALVRGLVGLALERPGIFLLGLGPALGMTVSMFSARGKRIGDMAAGTMVLQERVSTPSAWAPWMPAPLAGWALTLDLTGVDDSLALCVRQFLGRSYEFAPTAREALGAQLAAELQECTTPPPPPGTPGWAYLCAILAERRRREEERAALAMNRGAAVRAPWFPIPVPQGAPLQGPPLQGPPLQGPPPNYPPAYPPTTYPAIAPPPGQRPGQPASAPQPPSGPDPRQFTPPA